MMGITFLTPPSMFATNYVFSGLNSVLWSSDGVRKLFVSREPAEQHTENKMILIGSLVGGIIFLLITASLIWWFGRRIRRRASDKSLVNKPASTMDFRTKERLYVRSSVYELEPQEKTLELRGERDPVELL